MPFLPPATHPRRPPEAMRGSSWAHLCIDMQRMFAEDTHWHVPWMANISPAVIAVSGRHPEKTIFTRFVPPASAEDVTGMWKEYSEMGGHDP